MISRIVRTLLAMSILGGCIPALADDSIKIGVSGPFTGSAAFMGVSMRDGVRLAAAEINARGGLLGRKIALVERDDENKADRYLTIAEDLLNKEKVVATVGFINSAASYNAQKMYQNARVPVMTAVATDAQLATRYGRPWFPENYVFKLTFNDELQGQLIVEEAVRRRNLTKVAILVVEDYGQAGGEILARELEKLGHKPVLMERLKSREDMTPGVLRAKEAGAQAVLAFGYAGHMGKLAAAMQNLDWKAPIIGNWTLSMPPFIEAAGAAGGRAVMPLTFVQEGDTSRRKSFIDGYVKTFNPREGRIPSAMSAAQGYDSLHLLAAAIEQAGSTEGPRIREALENLRNTVEGVIATYERPFSSTDHEAIKKSMVVMGKISAGQVVRER